MSEPARIVVLVGPKGAGKTTLGRMLEREPGVHFLEVEAIAKRVLAEMGGLIDERYACRAFEAIVEAVEAIDRAYRVIVLETTGASDETPRFLDALRRGHEVRLVRVSARTETCAQRIAARDPSRQIDVSPELVRAMHEKSEALRLGWEIQICNDPPLSATEVARAFAAVLAP